MLPFVSELAYLHQMTLWQRSQISFLIFSVCYLFMWLGASPRNRKASAEMSKGIKNQIVKWLGFLLFIVSGALFNANIMSLLVLHTLPTQPFLSHVKVDQAKYQGSKSKSLYLTLHSQADGKTYYLTLAKKLFDYSKINVGDKMILKGQENFFGVHINNYEFD